VIHGHQFHLVIIESVLLPSPAFTTPSLISMTVPAENVALCTESFLGCMSLQDELNWAVFQVHEFETLREENWPFVVRFVAV
jgi:hypothetical protein